MILMSNAIIYYCLQKMQNKTVDITSLKQPPGLKILFLTEMWERFGFYTIQTLFVLYLVKVLLLTDTAAYGLFSAFTALTYACPVLGGFLADRFFGLKPTIHLGLILFIIGYGCLFIFKHAFPFYLSLSIIILGTGFIKGTISSLLGQFYGEHDIRRNAGFTLFYMGINLGSFFATVINSVIAVKFGFQYAFLLAGCGMVVAYIIFNKGQRYLEGKGELSIWKNSFFANHPILLVISCLFGAAILAIGLHFYSYVSNGILILLGILIFILIWNTRVLTKTQQHKMIVLALLLVFSTFFWALWFQTFLSITLFIDRAVDRQVFGFTIPTAMFQSFHSGYVIVFSPLLAKMWIWLERNNINPSGPFKFALGILFIGCAFLVLALAAVSAGPFDKVPASWFIITFFLQTLGELMLSPTGLVMVTKLAPPNWVGMLMGLWFTSLAAGNALAGKIANLSALPSQIPDNFAMTQFYGYTFNKLGWIAVAIAILLLACTPLIDRLVPNSEELS